MTPFSIVLADDDVILRQGLRQIIEEAAEVAVIGEADDGLDLIRLLRRLPCDMVILDIAMPRLRGIEAIPEIRAVQRHVKILILSMHRELDLLNAALSAGANGYILKQDADVEVFAAITRVRRGGTYVSPKLADEMTHDWARGSRPDAAPATDSDRLTLREREVLKLTAEGHTSREISGLLCISSRTVEHHRAHIMTKLGLRKNVDVVRYALNAGYLDK